MHGDAAPAGRLRPGEHLTTPTGTTTVTGLDPDSAITTTAHNLSTTAPHTYYALTTHHTPLLVHNQCGLPAHIRDLAEAHITSRGDTVLGPYPGYINKANARGASYFDIGAAWDRLTPTQRWAANRHFLDVVSSRGDRVLLSTSRGEIMPGTYLEREIAYLTQHRGYVWVNQWALRPGG